MAFQLPILGVRHYGKATASAGTAIVRLIQPWPNAYTRLASLAYTAAGTVHVLTVMRSLAVTTFLTDAAPGATTVLLATDPGNYLAAINVADNPIAANDYIAYETASGIVVLDTVSSVSGLQLVLSTALVGGVKSAGKLWFFGVPADTNPNDGQAQPQFTLPASATTKLGSDVGDDVAGFMGTIPGLPALGLDGTYEPLLLHVNNTTAAGVLEKNVALYTSA
jgi:hypothetical protein